MRFLIAKKLSTCISMHFTPVCIIATNIYQTLKRLLLIRIKLTSCNSRECNHSTERIKRYISEANGHKLPSKTADLDWPNLEFFVECL